MFLKDLVEDINKDNFAEKISLENMETQLRKEDFFIKNIGNSALRKVYDAYLDLFEKDNYEVEKQIWIAKIAYQEKRKLLPNGFAKALETIENKLGKDLFKKFLEVLVAYHKYLGKKD